MIIFITETKILRTVIIYVFMTVKYIFGYSVTYASMKYYLPGTKGDALSERVFEIMYKKNQCYFFYLIILPKNISYIFFLFNNTAN